jgi:hypothetical protein
VKRGAGARRHPVYPWLIANNLSLPEYRKRLIENGVHLARIILPMTAVQPVGRRILAALGLAVT